MVNRSLPYPISQIFLNSLRAAIPSLPSTRLKSMPVISARYPLQVCSNTLFFLSMHKPFGSSAVMSPSAKGFTNNQERLQAYREVKFGSRDPRGDGIDKR